MKYFVILIVIAIFVQETLQQQCCGGGCGGCGGCNCDNNNAEILNLLRQILSYVAVTTTADPWTPYPPECTVPPTHPPYCWTTGTPTVSYPTPTGTTWTTSAPTPTNQTPQ